MIYPSKPQTFFYTDYRYVDLSDQSVISSSSDQYSGTGTSFTARILNAYVLAPGSTYKFIVNVNDGSKTGSSNIIVEVRSGPTSGSFEVQPLSLEQLQEITLKGNDRVYPSHIYIQAVEKSTRLFSPAMPIYYEMQISITIDLGKCLCVFDVIMKKVYFLI